MNHPLWLNTVKQSNARWILIQLLKKTKKFVEIYSPITILYHFEHKTVPDISIKSSLLAKELNPLCWFPW